MTDLDLDLLAGPGARPRVGRNRWTPHRRAAPVAVAASPRRLRATLAGEGAVTVFALFSSSAGPRVLLPLDAPAALRLHYRTRVLPTLPPLGRALVRAGLATGMAARLVPGYVAAAVPADAPTALSERLRAEWPRLFGGPTPARVHLARLSTRPGPRSTATLLVFADDATAPAAVLKVNRDVAYPDAVRAEFQNFSAIHTRLRACRDGVPQPLFCERLGDRTVFAQTFVTGCPLPVAALAGRGARRDAAVIAMVDAAFDWLETFHGETAVGHIALDETYLREAVTTPFAAVRDRLPPAAPLAAELAALAERIAKFQGSLLPRAAVHGDFTHGNVLLDGRGAVRVVDWEDCLPAGPALVDVFFLLAQLALNHEGDDDGDASFRRFLLGDSPARRRVFARLDAYAARYGLDPRLPLLLFPAFLADLLARAHPDHRAPETYGFATLPCLETAIALSRTLA